jgi:hypothetical protein
LALPPPAPEPQEIWSEAVARAGAELARCSAAGTALQVYGDVRIRVHSGRRWTLSPSRSLGAHGARLAACVRRAISKHFELSGDLGGSAIDDSVLIGTPRRLLPAPAQLTPIWLRARGAAGRDAREATRALRTLVPRDYVLTRDLCFRTERPSARYVEESWSAAVGELVAPIWLPLLSTVFGDPVSWANWIAAGALLTRSARGLCLEPLGPELQAGLRPRFEEVGTGWVGGFTEILLRPRVELPRDRRYAAVATQSNRICAVTVGGAVECVGPTDPPLPPAPGPVVSLALGHDFACGLDVQGAALCWGNMVAAPPGPFRKISAGYRRACGLRFTGEIECWSGGAPIAPPPRLGGFVDVAIGMNICGVRRDGSAECSGHGMEPHPPGRFTSVAMDWGHACAVRTDGTVGCWSFAGQPVDTPTPGRFKDIATGSIYPFCGRRADDTVACWTSGSRPAPTPPTTAKLVQIAGYHDTFCGVRRDGGVDCWGDLWPGRSLAGRYEVAP